MGNRGNIIFCSKDEKNISCCIYTHWNGSAESIYAFLDELDRRNIRADQDYECARFIHLVGEFFDQETIGGLSLGVTNGPKKITAEELRKVNTDDSNNGFYIVCRNYDTETKTHKRNVRRFIVDYKSKDEKGKNTYGLKEMGADEVEAERVEAYKSDYIIGENSMPKTFIELQGKRGIEG